MAFIIPNYFGIGEDREEDVLVLKKKMSLQASNYCTKYKRKRMFEIFENNTPVEKRRSESCNNERDLFESPNRLRSTVGKGQRLHSQNANFFSKFKLNYFHVDLILTRESDRLHGSNNRKRSSGSSPHSKVKSEEKQINYVMKIFKENSLRNNFMFDAYFKENNKVRKSYLKKCCLDSENRLTPFQEICNHVIRYNLITYTQLLRESLYKKHLMLMRVLLFAYDFIVSDSKALLSDMIKLFFIPIPLMLSPSEKKLYKYEVVHEKQSGILSAIEFWLSKRKEDFQEDEELQLLLQSFLYTNDLIHQGNHAKVLAQIRDHIAKLHQRESSTQHANSTMARQLRLSRRLDRLII